MSGLLFKRIDCDVEYLISAVDKGRIGLPAIQRPLAWSEVKVRDLFDSMFHGFPIGSLLLWAAPQNEVIKQLDIEGQGTYTPVTLVIDGQQRLASLYSVMGKKPASTKGPAEQTFSIAFKPSTGEFEVSSAVHSRSPEWIADISDLYMHCEETYKCTAQFIGRLAERHKLLPNENETIAENIQRVLQLKKFPMTVLEINADTDEEDVATIFARINNQGKQLNQADFIMTLISSFWEEGRTSLETFCEQSREPGVKYNSSYNYFIEPDPVQMLRVAVGLGFRRARLGEAYLILRGKDPEKGQSSPERRDHQFEKLKWAQMKALYLKNWHEFLEVPVYAGYSSASMVTSETTLIYSYVFYLIGKYDFNVDHHTLQNIVAQWFFMSSVTDRYSSSPESRMEQDLANLRTIKDSAQYIHHLKKIIEDELDNDFWMTSLPTRLSTDAARNPAWVAYCAALNMLKAPALFSKMLVSEYFDPLATEDITAIERHFLFPQKHIAKMGVNDDHDHNQIANVVLAEWDNSIHHSDSPPEEYLSKYIERFKNDPEKLTQMMALHALPAEWEHMPYDDFLRKRRRLMAEVIKTGYQRLANIGQDNKR